MREMHLRVLASLRYTWPDNSMSPALASTATTATGSGYFQAHFSHVYAPLRNQDSKPGCIAKSLFKNYNTSGGEYGRRDPSRWPRNTLYPQKLALTSPTSGGRPVGIVRSRTQTMEFVCLWRFSCLEISSYSDRPFIKLSVLNVGGGGWSLLPDGPVFVHRASLFSYLAVP
jgi:hypothetical protein